MEKYTCIVVDDEALARELIALHIQKLAQLEVVAYCSNAIEARFALQNHQPDLLFLDIQMSNLSGFELLRMLKHKPATIITTAFGEYALESYELDVIDYLLKPIEFERFFKAVSKAQEWLEKGKSIDLTLASTTNTYLEPPPEFMFIKSDYKIVKLVFNEIMYIEALQKYVRIHLQNSRIISLMSMSQFEAKLPNQQFFRIHRSFIVNIAHINRVEGNTAYLANQELPISKGQKSGFLELMKK